LDAQLVGVAVAGRVIRFADVERVPGAVANALHFAIDRTLGVALGGVDEAVKANMFPNSESAAAHFVDKAIESISKGQFGSVSSEISNRELDLITAIARVYSNRYSSEAAAAQDFWAKKASNTGSGKYVGFDNWVKAVRSDARIDNELKSIAAARAQARVAAANTVEDDALFD
jgi:hypothetical protein